MSYITIVLTIKILNKMTQEEKVEFINQNINLVPKTMKSRFAKMDVDQQFEKMQTYVKWDKAKKEAQEMTKLAMRVKQLFISKKAKIEDANAVIKFCNEYIKTCKIDEIAKIDAELQRLTELRSQLQQEQDK